MRILVVEDEEDLAGAVAAGLRREGYAVDVAGDGRAALERLDVNAYDMVCLDLNLPDVDGLDICRHVVNALPSAFGHAEKPKIIILSARDGIDDRITGLDHGADDYLVKPFALGELAARVRALLRRDGTGTGAVLRWEGIELDAARHVVTLAGRTVDLTPKEFALLRFLLLHPDEVHSAERLLEHVWDEHADPFTNTVRVTISNLRRKLADAGGAQPIETVTGRGYRLVKPAEAEPGRLAG
jgi:DNA-binding response OmpR family regulator